MNLGKQLNLPAFTCQRERILGYLPGVMMVKGPYMLVTNITILPGFKSSFIQD